MDITSIITALGTGYLLGSIPFGLVLVKLAGLGDIRQIGSGNIGTTNVLRTGRKDIAALTLLLDAAKAGIAGLVIAHFIGQPFGFMAAGAALFGHCYPIWLRFKGGKGVATFFGALLCLVWPVGLGAALIWLGTAYLTRYSSLSALMAAIFAPLAAYIFAPRAALYMCLFMTAIILWRHRENIGRLLKGQESKIGQKS